MGVSLSDSRTAAAANCVIVMDHNGYVTNSPNGHHRRATTDCKGILEFWTDKFSIQSTFMPHSCVHK